MVGPNLNDRPVDGQAKRPADEVDAVTAKRQAANPKAPAPLQTCGLEVIAAFAAQSPRLEVVATSSPRVYAKSPPAAEPTPPTVLASHWQWCPTSDAGSSASTAVQATATVHQMNATVVNVQTQRRPWLQTEDDTIRRLVSVHGTRSWEMVAQQCPGRSGKQCRERWHNHLDQNIKKSAWCAATATAAAPATAARQSRRVPCSLPNLP